MTDRRLYVHEGSFGAMCLDFPDEAAPVLHALGLAVTSRIVQHRLVVDAEGVGLVPDGTFAGPATRVEITSCDHLTRAFCGLVYAPPEGRPNDETRPLLDRAERIEAMCWENGYFTFATGRHAAEVMFEETGSLRALRSEVRQSPGAHPDLTMLSGRRLFPYSSAIGTGPSTQRRYLSTALETPGTIPNAVAPVVTAQVERLFGDRRWGPSEGELVDSCLAAARVEVQRLFDRLDAAAGHER